jgi:NADPH2:quinone reductase
MRAAWYETQGAPEDVLVVGEMPDPIPQAGEVRIRVRASGVNPGEIKKRQGWLRSAMPYPRVVPHSDGAGEIDAVGVAQIRTIAPGGVDRVVEVSFGPNAVFNSQVVSQGAVIATYATPDPEPVLPYWPLAFQNVVIRLLGSDDFPQEAKRQAAADLVSCFEAGALRTEIRQIFPLDRIADAHRAVASPTGSGRVVVGID